MESIISDAWYAQLDDLPKEERINAIDDAIHRLNFERRLTLLTKGQLQHMNCILSESARKALEKLEGTPAFDHKIQEYARSHYFRECAWVSYLNDGGEPPFPAVDGDG